MRKILLIGLMTFWACVAMAQEEYHIKVFGQTDEYLLFGVSLKGRTKGHVYRQSKGEGSIKQLL